MHFDNEQLKFKFLEIVLSSTISLGAQVNYKGRGVSMAGKENFFVNQNENEAKGEKGSTK